MESPIISLNRKIKKKPWLKSTFYWIIEKNYIFVEFTKNIRDFGPRYSIVSKRKVHGLCPS